MLWGATRDDHLDTVYSQLKVFIPTDLDKTQVFRVLGVAPSVQNKDFFQKQKPWSDILLGSHKGLFKNKLFEASSFTRRWVAYTKNSISP